MKTSNFITRAIGAFVLKIFTDGSMPFEATDDERALQQKLDALDLRCPQDGFALNQAHSVVVYKHLGTSFLGFLVGRMLGRNGTKKEPPNNDAA